MAAYTDPETTEAFSELLTELADEAEYRLDVEDGADAGWLVPRGETLLVRGEDGDAYLITVKRVSDW